MEIGSGFQTINKTRNVKRIQKQIDKFVLTAGDLHYGSKKVYNAWRQHTDTPEA